MNRSTPITYLLGAAQAASVSWIYRDGDVVLRGPKAAEPIIVQLMCRKSEVIEMLKPRRCSDCGEPSGSCPLCHYCAAARAIASRHGL